MSIDFPDYINFIDKLKIMCYHTDSIIILTNFSLAIVSISQLNIIK